MKYYHQNKTAPEPRVRQKRKKNILVILVYLCSRPAQGGGAGLVKYYHQNKTAPEPPLPILLTVTNRIYGNKAARFARNPGYVIRATRARDQNVIVIVLTRASPTNSRLLRGGVVRGVGHIDHV